MPYTKQHDPWADYPDTSTPITAAALDGIEAGIATATTGAETGISDAAAAQADIDAHIADATDAHDASAVSVLDTGAFYSGTDVEAVLAEIGPQLGAGSSASAVTALPSSPSDGDEIIFMDSLTAPTYAWHLRYIDAKASNKWQFIGGSELWSEVTTSETTTASAYTALSTAGPSVTLPLAGDYFVEIGAKMDSSAETAPVRMSYDIGGTGAVDADAVGASTQIGRPALIDITRVRKKAGLTAVALTAKYKSDGTNTATISDRRMRVWPIAVGG